MATDNEPKSVKFDHTNQIFNFTLPSNAETKTPDTAIDPATEESTDNKTAAMGEKAQK